VQRLREIARRSGVEHRVRFVGAVARADLPALMRSADAVVCVPWYEPFGIVPLEAMACGVPVVAAAVGGLVDTVVDGVTGVHVPPRDTAALSAALLELLADRRRRLLYGRAGANRARSRYGWNRIATSTLATYRALTEDVGVEALEYRS
jgi:glycosyltransferase involved in cell wall biosynthesis